MIQGFFGGDIRIHRNYIFVKIKIVRKPQYPNGHKFKGVGSATRCSFLGYDFCLANIWLKTINKNCNLPMVNQ